MRNLPGIFSLIAILILTGTIASAKPVSRNVAVDEDFAEYQFDWSRTGGFYIRYSPLNVDGQLEVCIAMSDIGQRMRADFNQVALKEARFTVNGQSMLRGLNFASKSSSKKIRTGLIGEQANCVATGKPFPHGAFNYGIEFRKGRYRVRR